VLHVDLLTRASQESSKMFRVGNQDTDAGGCGQSLA
jgi:hypothetical protein